MKKQGRRKANKRERFRWLRELKPLKFLFLTLAGIINAIGVTLFLAPVSLFDSGISGTAMLLNWLLPEPFTLSLFLIVLNVPLFLYGWKRQGTTFTIYSLYAVLVYSVMAWVIKRFSPWDLVSASPFAGEDLLLCAVFGGILSGVGSGLTIRIGGALDGIEVMAVTFAKRLGITVGTFVMVFNVVLYAVAGILTGNWRLPLYSIIAYACALKTVDFIVEGFDRSKSVMIITGHGEAVNEALLKAFESGTTKLKGKGGYSNADKTVIYFVVNRFQIAKLRTVVYQVDPEAYVTVTEVADVMHAESNKEVLPR